jgi:hypothetical protein
MACLDHPATAPSTLAHSATVHSNEMVSIANRDGDLFAVLTGPQAADYASAMIGLPSLLVELEAALPPDDGPPTPLVLAVSNLLTAAGVFMAAR